MNAKINLIYIFLYLINFSIVYSTIEHCEKEDDTLGCLKCDENDNYIAKYSAAEGGKFTCQCEEGYLELKYRDKFSCYEKIENCNEYFVSIYGSECKDCSKGYFDLKSHSCILPKNCLEIDSQENHNCTKCEEGYGLKYDYITDLNVCLKCPPNTISCTFNGNFADQFSLVCLPGYGQDRDGIACKPCSKGCDSCTIFGETELCNRCKVNDNQVVDMNSIRKKIETKDFTGYVFDCSKLNSSVYLITSGLFVLLLLF